MRQITVPRTSYQRKDGTRVKPATFKVKDRGKPGKTPKRQQWFDPGEKLGWGKNLPIDRRRHNALKAHKGNLLATARSLQALANVATDTMTVRKAREDALYFYRKYQRGMRQHDI